MQAIVLKYIQLFCVAVFFDNVNCDQMEVGNYQRDDLPQKVRCTAQCLRENLLLNISSCFYNCDNKLFLDTKPIEIKSTTYQLKLICRDDTSLVLEIHDVRFYNSTNTKDLKPIESNSKENHSEYHTIGSRNNLYIFKLRSAEDTLSQNIVYIADVPFVVIKNLTANTTFKVFAMVVNDVEYSHVITDSRGTIKTLETNYMPGKVRNIEFGQFMFNNDTKLFNVEITWFPAKDMTCTYSFYARPKSSSMDEDFRQEEINKYFHFYHHMVTNLTFGSEYEIGLSAYNKRNPRNSLSDIFWRPLTTPTCLQWYNNSLDKCAPYKPKNIKRIEEWVSLDIYNVNITWDEPPSKPNYYLVTIENYTSNITVNVTGDRSHAYIEGVNLTLFYYINVTAVSMGGNSSSEREFTLDNISPIIGKYRNLKILLFIGVPIFMVTAVTIITATFYSRHKKIKRNRQLFKYFEELEKKAPVDPNSNFTSKEKHLLSLAQFKIIQDDFDCKNLFNDALELPKENVRILNVIGEGAFGYVRRAILMPNGIEVAVKMLKDGPTIDEIKGFYREIEVMKSVEKHPNILGIVGHCTKNIFELMLLTEYCSKGSLLLHLRKIWHQLNKRDATIERNSIVSTWSRLKTPENEFNFETSIIEKNTQKYKNIIDNNNESEYYMIDEDNLVPSTSSSNITISPKGIINNKLYGITFNYHEDSDSIGKPLAHCNNFCKSNVEVMSANGINQRTINVADCECGSHMDIQAANLMPHLLVENMAYEREDIGNTPNLQTINEKNFIKNKKDSQITSKDLISFAFQIANGMAFLSHNKVVHRDLAARNVLISADNTAKIADFGLSRDVYQENMYKKAGDGKLPIKWLALESMTHQIYTSQSDVWSFGVLLYEIITLGSSPYPSIPASNLLGLLKRGYRMDKPSNCANNLYALMLTCWHPSPHERPTFADITKRLGEFLEIPNDNELIDLKFDVEQKRVINSTALESYLNAL